MSPVPDDRNRHRGTMSAAKTHLAQGCATLIEVGTIHDDQIEFVPLQMFERVAGVQGDARGNTKALNCNPNHMRQFEIAGQNESFRRHLVRVPRV